MCTCHFPYLYPVEDLLIAGHVLQEKSLQLLAQLLRRQDLFRRRSLSAGAVQQNELQFLFVSTNDEEVTNKEKMIKRRMDAQIFLGLTRGLSVPTCCEMKAWTSSPSGRKSVQLRPDSLHKELTVLWL